MSRQVGQLSTRQALAGAALIIVGLAAVIALCELLLQPVERVPALGTPAQAARPLPAPPCPDPEIIARLPGPVEVSSDDLVNCPRAFDAQRVRYTGEVVAAILDRGDHAWVQLNDDPYGTAVGPLPAHRLTVGGNAGAAVAIPAEVARAVRHVGGHNAAGDAVAVEGTFRRADPDDGGGPTIRADRARIVAEGSPIEHEVLPLRIGVAALLAALAAWLGLRLRLQRRR